MGFPFHFNAKFVSVDYPSFRFRQTDFFMFRDFLKRKYPDLNVSRNELEFDLTHVFGFMNFSVRIEKKESFLHYSIDMIPVVLTTLLLLFASLFLAQGGVMLSLAIGFLSFILIYSFSVLIVNGMVRRLIEEFVKKEMKRLEDKVVNPVCIVCGTPMKAGQTKCQACEGRKESQGPSIKYSYTPNQE